MKDPSSPSQKGGLSFFATWLLLHEKADDWIRDAIRRARETPEDVRHDYQLFLLEVEREKEALKSIAAEAFTNEIKQMGFVHADDTHDLKAELDELRRRLRGIEEKMERRGSDGKG